eukprot:TRINITY_DN24662_c0_g1_i4.p1 TRINITY_DN24662_c0_g1~~TRINITY_DN24662_c0_g1_i4.p1  ORF type:complete len:418 (+),score=12.07 TRINITY_DN24662_c0_g1_i4:141-1256(+)
MKKIKFKYFENIYLEYFLKNGYSLEEIQMDYLPHYSIYQLRRQAKKLGFKGYVGWTGRDLMKLKHGINEGLTYLEICQKYLPYRTPNALASTAYNQNWKPAIPWSINELFLLDLGLYKDLSLQEIQSIFLPNRLLIQLQARRTKPNWNASLYDSNFYFSPDDIRLSCIAGFILADGHICKKTYQIMIGISEKDLDFLEWICDVLQLDKQSIRSVSAGKGKPRLVKLIIPAKLSRLFVKHFHLHPDKSKGKVVFPSFLNDQCLKAFLIGLLYGDGHISKSKRNNAVTLCFSSSNDFLVQLLRYVQDNGFYCRLKKSAFYKYQPKHLVLILLGYFFTVKKPFFSLVFCLNPFFIYSGWNARFKTYWIVRCSLG